VVLASGVAVGLLVGVGAAVARDAWDTRIRRPADVPRWLGVPVLAALGGRRGVTEHDRRRLVSLLLTASAASGAPVRSVLVVPSTHRVEGTAAMLVTALREARHRATLLVADPDGTPEVGSRPGAAEAGRVREADSRLVLDGRERADPAETVPDALLVVVDLPRTRGDELSDLLEQLRHSRPLPIGIVTLGLPRHHSGRHASRRGPVP
jgi:hypothetical protein